LPRLKQLGREALINIAIDVINERGLTGCTFRTLAKEAGTTTAPFTYEFGSRAKMLQAISEQAWEKLGSGVTVEVKPGDSPVAVLKAGCDQWIPTNPADIPYLRVYLEMFFHSIDQPDLNQAVSVVSGDGARRWVDIVKAAQKAGEIDPARDAEDILTILWSVTDGLLLGAAAHPDYFSKQRLTRVWEEAFAAIVSWSPKS